MNQPSAIQMIPIEQINILNPRFRNRRVFSDIKENIQTVGLKRPITVTHCQPGVEGKLYDLVCGQGRLEAFMASNQIQIPAIVIDASQEQALVMSLVENLARRQHRAMDLMKGITILLQQGYGVRDIANKTGLSFDYTQVVINLLDQGEERLLAAVEGGIIPITVAASIAMSPGNEQQALQDAYEGKLLRGQRLITAQKLIETRRLNGKHIKHGGPKSDTAKVSARDLVKVFQNEVERKRQLISKAERTSTSLVFLTEALRRLLKEDHFSSILQAEGFTTLPQPLAELIQVKA